MLGGTCRNRFISQHIGYPLLICSARRALCEMFSCVWSVHLMCMIETLFCLVKALDDAKKAESCWSKGHQKLCYWSLTVAGMTSTPSLFTAFCLLLCLALLSNGNQKGHGGRSQSSALMTLASRQRQTVFIQSAGLPTRSHCCTLSLCRVSSESSHLAILCDFPLRNEPNHFLIDTLISWQHRSLPVSTFEYSRVYLSKHRRSHRFQPKPESTCQQRTPRRMISLPMQ